MTHLIDLRTVKTGSATATVEIDPVWTGDKPNYVPYTGATTNVNLGTNNITAGNIGGNSTCSKLIFNSTVWFGVGSGC